MKVQQTHQTLNSYPQRVISSQSLPIKPTLGNFLTLLIALDLQYQLLTLNLISMQMQLSMQRLKVQPQVGQLVGTAAHNNMKGQVIAATHTSLLLLEGTPQRLLSHR